MKICDRCHKNGETVKAYDNIMFGNDQDLFDVCKSCKDDIREFVMSKPKKSNRSKKETD